MLFLDPLKAKLKLECRRKCKSALCLAQACAVALKSGLDKTACPTVEEPCWCRCCICKCFEGSVDFKWALATGNYSQLSGQTY